MTPAIQATGATATITFGKKDYTISPLTDQDFAELDLWLRGRIIKAARASLTPDMSTADVDLTMQQAFRFANAVTWVTHGVEALATPDGLARFLWQAMKAAQPTLTVNDVLTLIMAEPAKAIEFWDLFDLMHDVKKNGGKPGSLRRRKRRPRRLTPDSSTGPCPSDTAGRPKSSEA